MVNFQIYTKETSTELATWDMLFLQESAFLQHNKSFIEKTAQRVLYFISIMMLLTHIYWQYIVCQFKFSFYSGIYMYLWFSLPKMLNALFR